MGRYVLPDPSVALPVWKEFLYIHLLNYISMVLCCNLILMSSHAAVTGVL